MHPLEVAVLEWIAARHPAMKGAIEAQAAAAIAVGREYTKGGGVFVEFSFPVAGPKASVRTLPNSTNERRILEGPHIQSSELEAGAEATLSFAEAGLMSSLEIQALANDYPPDRHPENFRLLDPGGTYIDLRSTQ